MKLKFNGWQRLWIVVCALYLICVLVRAIAIFPSQIYTGHDKTLEKQLTPKSLSRLIDLTKVSDKELLNEVNKKREATPKDLLASEWEQATPIKIGESVPQSKKAQGYSLEPIDDEDKPKPGSIVTSEQLFGHEVEMPDGHILVFKAGLKENEVQSVALEYNKIIERKLNIERFNHMLQALLLWILPSIFLYIFGWSIGWIYRGFKKA